MLGQSSRNLHPNQLQNDRQLGVATNKTVVGQSYLATVPHDNCQLRHKLASNLLQIRYFQHQTLKIQTEPGWGELEDSPYFSGFQVRRRHWRTIMSARIYWEIQILLQPTMPHVTWDIENLRGKQQVAAPYQNAEKPLGTWYCQ